MSEPTGPTGHLWAVIREWMDAHPYGASQRRLAKRVGVSHGLITEWKYARSMPNPEHLHQLAHEIEAPYERVLDAMLRDHGYREPTAELRESIATIRRKLRGRPIEPSTDKRA